MNSRERVLTALDHREPDQVPVSFGDIAFSSIFDYPPYGYRALCDYLGIADYTEPISFHDDAGTVANIDERLRQRLGADLRYVAAGSSYREVHLPDGGCRSAWGLVRHKIGPYWELDDGVAPLRNAEDVADLDAFVGWPDPTDPAIVAGKREDALAIRASGYAVTAAPGMAMAVGHNYAFLRGFELYMLDMLGNTRFFNAFCDRIVEWSEAYLEAFLTPIADVVDLVMMAEDMGTQDALFMSPQHYRKYLKPYHARVAAAIKRAAPRAKIILHSCGSIYPIIPDFIEMGVEVLEPVQPRAAMMEPWRLKRDFGDSLSFLGGTDIQELLPHGTPEQVRDGVKELIDAYAPGGGYILAPSHQFQPDIPPENIVAMYDTAREYGRYPLPRQPAMPGR
jgi:uroporphyrinogen decarboxylase